MGRKNSPPTSPTTCSECGATDTIQIELALPDGAAVLFNSCDNCENRWWDQGGKELAIEQVLKLARKGKR